LIQKKDLFQDIFLNNTIIEFNKISNSASTRLEKSLKQYLPFPTPLEEEYSLALKTMGL
jgi:hypothetical protein